MEGTERRKGGKRIEEGQGKGGITRFFGGHCLRFAPALDKNSMQQI